MYFLIRAVLGLGMLVFGMVMTFVLPEDPDMVLLSKEKELFLKNS